MHQKGSQWRLLLQEVEQANEEQRPAVTVLRLPQFTLQMKKSGLSKLSPGRGRSSGAVAGNFRLRSSSRVGGGGGAGSAGTTSSDPNTSMRNKVNKRETGVGTSGGGR